MPRKEIANLKIVVDTDTKDVGSIRRIDKHNYELLLTPNTGSDVPVNNMSDLRTIFAHELGHFLLMVTRDASQHPSALMWQVITQDSSLALKGEQQAWYAAQQIYPELDPDLAMRCLRSYESSANPNARLEVEIGGKKIEYRPVLNGLIQRNKVASEQARERATNQGEPVSMRGRCGDCGQGSLEPVHTGFALFNEEPDVWWYCLYCGSNHVDILDENGDVIVSQGDLYKR